ncbi:schwannomin-interacting protein 1 homolog isoform X1 [Camponotus floridanus]|nr:schwannomin-interacting protein 1 homolog isoform X1 [Camponotus floridanus]XP_011253244.1 schwannomin-interacting protein 1 homolog isoform X1 [Camponotus floridanus]
MRLRESVSISVPLHPGGLNNNQLRRPEPIGAGEIAGDRNENATREPVDESADFRLAEDTTTWSSLAIARDNVQQSNPQSTNVNNNLTEPKIQRNSSVESLADYEGTIEEQSANVNNNPIESRIRRNSSVESLTDCEGRNSPHENSSRELTPSEWSDWSEEGNLPAGCRGIVNPNYPGFQHLAPSLLSDTDLTEDEHDSCSDYPPLYGVHPEIVPENGNEYNNNVDDSINHLCGQRNDRKIFYEKPKFNIQTVTSLYESVVPPSEKCINYVKSVEVSRSEKKAQSPEPEEVVVNGVVEAETHLTLLDEREEGLADQVSEQTPELSRAVLENKREREVPVEVELVELTTSVNESLQFPEIEEILDSGKTSEISETEDVAVEHIDLIREAKELPHLDRSKIGNRQPVTTSAGGSADDDESESNSDYSEGFAEERPTYTKLEEIDLLSSIGRDIGVDFEKYAPVPDVVAMESIESIRGGQSRATSVIKDRIEDTNKLLDRELPEASSADVRKKEKMVKNQAKRRQQQQQQQQSRNSNSQRRPDKRRADIDGSGGFDVYNIETAMPKIDLDAIESHLRAAREEERRDNDKGTEPNKPPEPSISVEQETKESEREDLITRFDRVIRGESDCNLQRRNDREEIRRRLAMGPDAEDLRAERGRKPSLQSRLQSGMNLQICFMNETSSDTESPGSENDTSPGSTPTSLGSKQLGGKQHAPMRPQVLSLPSLRLESANSTPPVDEADFFARQARLQTEARMALAQAKEMAHMQMEVERQRLKQSPITEMVRCSLEKVGVQLGEDRRRLSRVLLTELNVAQLQVVANDLHARIAALNEALVEGLLRRDDLHMEQDSMLVDVEDLTRYLGAKQESLKKKQQSMQQTANRNHQQSSPTPTKLSMKPKLTHLNRGLVALVRK